MNKFHSLWLAACGLISAAMLAHPSSPVAPSRGGPEVNCDPNGNEILERWMFIPTNGLSWWLARDTAANGLRAAPGYPGWTCTPAGQKPGLQSVRNAGQTWSSIPLPLQLPSTSKVSTFKLATSPAGYITQDSGGTASLLVVDQKNVVTLLEPAATFTPFGGAATLGLAAVTLNAGLAIVEADIALNTRTAVAGREAWSFVEANALTGLNHATSLWNGAGAYPAPASGYADLQGVLTHEFGHFAGLAESLVDAQVVNGASDNPTMFPIATIEPYAGTSLRIAPGGGCGYSAPSAPAGATLAGKPAQSLELDDICAIGTAYPTVAFWTQLGTITGTIYDFGGSSPSTAPAVHVVAIKAGDPSQSRVGTFSYANGIYTVRGLPPGEWYVYAERADINGYFRTTPVPNYVFPGPSSPSCITSGPPDVKPDFHSGDIEDINGTLQAYFGRCEGDHDRAQAVTVTAGASASGVDIRVVGFVPCPAPLYCYDGIQWNWVPPTPLVAIDPVTGQQSPRGVVMFPTSGPTVSIVVQAPLPRTFGAGNPCTTVSPWAGKPVTLRWSTTLGATPVSGGSPDQLNLLGGTVVTFGTATFPAGGVGHPTVTFVVPLSALAGPRTNVFFQAIVDPENPATPAFELNVYTNMVNVMRTT